MTTETETAVTPYQAASLATRIDPALVEQAVAALPLEELPEYRVRTEQAIEKLHALRKAMDQRMAVEGFDGKRFVVDGREWGFWGSVQKGFKAEAIADLLMNLKMLGLNLADLFGAASDLRVTDLRAAVQRLSGEEAKKAALDLMEQARHEKGDRGAPHLQEIDRVIGAKGDR